MDGPTQDTLRVGDFGWLAVFAASGMVWLIRARIAFARLEMRTLMQRNESAMLGRAPGGDADAELLARIAYVLPRISRRLPWRSDCLVQAIAGQDWLAAHGIAGEIRIGVERPEDAGFGAHAWLVAGEKVILGGDISRYEAIFGQASGGNGKA